MSVVVVDAEQRLSDHKHALHAVVVHVLDSVLAQLSDLCQDVLHVCLVGAFVALLVVVQDQHLFERLEQVVLSMQSQRLVFKTHEEGFEVLHSQLSVDGVVALCLNLAVDIAHIHCQGELLVFQIIVARVVDELSAHLRLHKLVGLDYKRQKWLDQSNGSVL